MKKYKIIFKQGGCFVREALTLTEAVKLVVDSAEYTTKEDVLHAEECKDIECYICKVNSDIKKK